MKNHRIFLISLIILAAISLSAVYSADSTQLVDGLNATSDLNQALTDAASQNKTAFLLFDQSSCYYCDLLKQDVLSNSDVQKELNENFIVVCIDVNKNATLAGQHKVVGTPDCIFLDSTGKEVHRIDGYLPADEFLNSIKEI